MKESKQTKRNKQNLKLDHRWQAAVFLPRRSGPEVRPVPNKRHRRNQSDIETRPSQSLFAQRTIVSCVRAFCFRFSLFV